MGLHLRVGEIERAELFFFLPPQNWGVSSLASIVVEEVLSRGKECYIRVTFALLHDLVLELVSL